jgi:hypothetical protein
MDPESGTSSKSGMFSQTSFNLPKIGATFPLKYTELAMH